MAELLSMTCSGTRATIGTAGALGQWHAMNDSETGASDAERRWAAPREEYWAAHALKVRR